MDSCASTPGLSGVQVRRVQPSPALAEALAASYRPRSGQRLELSLFAHRGAPRATPDSIRHEGCERACGRSNVNSQLAMYAALTLLAVGSLSQTALADAAPETNAPAPPEPITSPPTEPATDTTISDAKPNVPERGFLFVVEPSVPDPLHAVVSVGMGNVARTGEERPVGSGPVFPTLGAEVGLLPRLSVYAEGGAVVIQSGNPGQLASPFILDAGFHVLLTDPTSRMWRLSLR